MKKKIPLFSLADIKNFWLNPYKKIIRAYHDRESQSVVLRRKRATFAIHNENRVFEREHSERTIFFIDMDLTPKDGDVVFMIIDIKDIQFKTVVWDSNLYKKINKWEVVGVVVEIVDVNDIIISLAI